jgi:alanine-glyoxylate transaminase/serine-glyoxylate transaminase/serine-pyruvate transaminase
MWAATGVLSDAKAIAATVKRVSPETLVVIDGVCSVASEEIRFDEWGIDVVRLAYTSNRQCRMN